MLINKLANKLHRDRRGDTIVEVMIVLAVLGLAIGIAYATANRSLLNARQAQENSQATAAAQAQVEQLVSIGCTSGSTACDITNSANPGYALLHPPGTPFCIVNGTVKASTDPNSPTCSQQAPLPGAKVEITCLNSCASPRIFEIKISWDDALGQGTDTVTQDYVLPPNTSGAVGGGGGGGAVASCPSGYTGIYPNCHAPTCPAGQTGTPPNCQTPAPTCPAGQTGTPPDCGNCAWYETGTYPDCHAASL